MIAALLERASSRTAGPGWPCPSAATALRVQPGRPVPIQSQQARASEGARSDWRPPRSAGHRVLLEEWRGQRTPCSNLPAICVSLAPAVYVRSSSLDPRSLQQKHSSALLVGYTSCSCFFMTKRNGRRNGGCRSARTQDHVSGNAAQLGGRQARRCRFDGFGCLFECQIFCHFSLIMDK